MEGENGAAGPSCLSDEQVSAYVDGLASAEERLATERHFSECETCRNLADAVASTRSQGALGSPGIEAPLLRGDRVGRYRILERLGAGAMGTVYAAHDPSLDRKVALKLIRAQVAGPELEARLLREAKAMARLSHSEVISVFDAGRDGRRLFIAMELIDGGTLRQWCTKERRAWREILGVYLRAGRGLAEAHASGIIHRDFKPDNVLVGNDGRVRVTDFGLARTADVEGLESIPHAPSSESSALGEAHLTRTGALLGTPAYMAPEQLAGGAADARSDVYAFCVSLYEALYGERPFTGTTLLAQRTQKSDGTVAPPASLRQVPVALRRAILEGLRARPQDRYASMNDLLAALDRAARPSRLPFVALGVGLTLLATGVALERARNHSGATFAGSITPVTPTIAGGCTSSRACTEQHGGAPHVCRTSDGQCVAIESEDCKPLFEPRDLQADDTVWLGAMFPLKGPAAGDYGPSNLEGANSARREISEATRALDGSNASSKVRRIALVGCDDSTDPMRAAKHLVDLGVPAILGFRSGQEIVDIAGSLLIQKGVLTVASLSANPLVTRIPQPPDLPRMVWRTTYSMGAAAFALGALVEPVLQTRGPKTTAKLTFVRRDNAADLAFAESLFKTLRFNGKSSLENGGDYQEVLVPPGADPVLSAGSIADRVAATSPTLVIALVDLAANVPLLQAIEARTRRAPPIYMIPLNTMDWFKGYIGTNRDRRHRLFSVLSTSNSVTNARFVMRYNETHQEKVSRTFNPGSSYDAFYLLAYSTFSLGAGDVTGEKLARGFARLRPPGLSVDVGSTHVLESIAELRAGRSLDLTGTLGSLDLDPATGEPSSDMEILCAAVDANGRATGEDVASGVVFRAATQKVEGALRCP